uniref:small nuclear ribonucleoprotein G-like isoform X1 n=1 Tax=Oncorhynchus gorbuscha TaxID=8017 RepID=UPI001EAF09AF|nr:small nuclear ribonucleoprotein G-like isoform X1 [Oncorhynchus gorbuscha]
MAKNHEDGRREQLQLQLTSVKTWHHLHGRETGVWFMDKKLSLKLNGGRQVQGVLRGFDPFMNLVMDECLEMVPGGIQNTIGMVVIRGNSIIMLEALERV